LNIRLDPSLKFSALRFVTSKVLEIISRADYLRHEQLIDCVDANKYAGGGLKRRNPLIITKYVTLIVKFSISTLT